jgi:hypothetical protein
VVSISFAYTSTVVKAVGSSFAFLIIIAHYVKVATIYRLPVAVFTAANQRIGVSFVILEIAGNQIIGNYHWEFVASIGRVFEFRIVYHIKCS